MEQFDNNGNPVDEQTLDDQQGDEGGEQQQPDPLLSMKSEFSRKLENQNQRFDQLNERMEQMLNQFQRNQPQQPQQPEVNLRDLITDDPDTAVRIIEERAVRRASEVVDKRVQMSQAAQAAVLDIQGKYGEFSQEGSEASKIAISKAARLPDSLKGTPEGVRLAMMEAVAELGLVPSSKKRAPAGNSDDFAISGSSQPNRGQRRPTDPTKDIDPRTLEFAKLLNPDIASDPKRLESLKKHAGRKRWNSYE